MSDEQSPYAPPSAELTDTSSDEARAQITREEYINHEASIRSVGLLYYLAAVGGLLGGIGMLVAAPASEESVMVGIAVVYLALGVVMAFVGRGVRKLRRWVKIPVGFLSAIGLLGIPIGTLINGYILYLVFGKKGRFVFSDEYQAIIEQTPHIKYRTSIVIWLLLIIIFVGIVAAILIPLFAGT